MAMKRCPVCGEKYSDTYRNCPFCEEEDALREEEEFRRPPRRSSRSRQFNLITPTLIVLIIIMAALLIYLLYGDKFSKKDGGKDSDTSNPPISNTVDPEKPSIDTPPAGDQTPEDGSGQGGQSGENDGGGQSGVIPDTPSDSTPGGAQPPASNSTEMTYEKAMSLPSGGISLNKSDFTRSVSEGPYQLKASGGSGTITWLSQDPGVASVDATGKVTPISAGTVNIVATDGSKKAACIVRVKGGGGGTAAPSTQKPSGNSGSSGSSGSSNSSGSSALNRDDMTLSVGETFKLKLSGVTTAVNWSVGDSGIASVAGDGTVTGVSKGMTTVTASWDGQSRKCIVRVK